MSARTFPVQIGASSKVTALKDLISEKEGMEKSVQRVSASDSIQTFFEEDDPQYLIPRLVSRSFTQGRNWMIRLLCSKVK